MRWQSDTSERICSLGRSSCSSFVSPSGDDRVQITGHTGRCFFSSCSHQDFTEIWVNSQPDSCCLRACSRVRPASDLQSNYDDCKGLKIGKRPPLPRRVSQRAKRGFSRCPSLWQHSPASLRGGVSLLKVQKIGHRLVPLRTGAQL